MKIITENFKEAEQEWFNFNNSDYDEFKFLTELRSSSMEDYEEIIYDYLDYYDELSQELVDELKTNFNLSVDNIINYVYLISNYYYFLTDNNTYEKWCRKDDVSYKIEELDESEILKILEIKEENIYISGWECSIKRLQKHPSPVYHYTNEESWEQIQESGELEGSSGTGLGNRSVSGIFTSLDSEEYATGSYGDICLEIDLPRFKKDTGLDKLELYPEPEVYENELRNTLWNKLKNHIDRDLETYEISDSYGVSIFTVIVGHSIPINYIKAINI